MEKRAAVASGILCLPTHSGGTGLPKVQLETFTTPVGDWKNTFLHSSLGKNFLLNQVNGSEKRFFYDLKIFFGKLKNEN